MESRVYDPTLPLDFDGSSNMTDLPEVTLGSDPTSHDLQESVSQNMSPGASLRFPMVAKSNSGRMSPVRGRTMKEYDQQITELKKENFSLKLRIFFLEERMQQKYGDGEDVFKTNIELKVNVQSLKKELEDKQELLRKASQAMETLTSSQQNDIDTIKKSLEEQHHRYTDELRCDLQKALQDAEDARDELEVNRDKRNQLEVQLQQLELDLHQSNVGAQKLKDAVEMKEREISALQLESDSHVRDLEEAQRLLQEAEAQKEAELQKVQKMEKELQRRGRDVEQLSTALKDTSMIDGNSFLAPSHLQDVVDDQRDNLGRLEVKINELEDALKNKDELVGRLEDGLKEKDKGWKDASNRLEQLTKELEQEKQLGTRRDKTIQGLVSSLHKKEKEVTGAKARLSKSETALKTLRAELHEAEMSNHQEQLQQLNDHLVDRENSNRRLQTQLDDANNQVETMIKSLGKKEGELAGFREQLQRANQALKCSEEALEGLQEQLEKERNHAHHRLDSQAQEYQRTLEDYLHQLEGKDSLMAHMTAQMHAKDKQLTSLMDLLTDETSKGQKALLQRLEDDLNRSSSSAQMALEDKQAEVDRRGRELRDVRQALHDKGRELEQANLKLLERQEELEKIELGSRQQGEATAQLSNTLAKTQQSLEEALDRHAEAVQEKDAIIQRLQKALDEKEQMLEDLSQQSPSVDDQQRQLRARLREKDQLIQELQTECVKVSCEREQAARTTQARLQEKEEEIQALCKKQQKELLNRDQEIQGLMSQLNKKELQLDGLQSRLTDAELQHKEAVQSMRRMLAEKEKTIAALVDSVGEKEQLLRRSQQNLTEDAKAQMAELDTLLSENSRLKRLLREKEEALQDELRQKTLYDNRETHRSSHHENVNYTTNVDNTKVCQLLEEQIRESRKLTELLHKDHNQVVVNLNSEHVHSDTGKREEEARPSEAEAALQAELSAVSALRHRLLEGVERNQQLHRSLLGHTVRQGDHLTSGDSSPDSLHLDSLGGRLQPQSCQQTGFDEIDGCPGISNVPVLSLRNLQDVAKGTPAGKGSGQKTLAVQPSSFLGGVLSDEARGELRELGVDTEHVFTPSATGEGGVAPTQPLTANITCNLPQQVLSRERSQDSVSSIASLSSDQLAGMSAAVLRDLVSQLQEDLIASAQQNAMLHRQLDGFEPSRAGAGGAAGPFVDRETTSSAASDLQTQVDSLKNALKLKAEETARLREHFGLSPNSDAANHTQEPLRSVNLHDQAHSLRQQVKEMNKVNSALKEQIAISPSANLSQTGDSAPQIARMAAEIERLRVDNAHLCGRLKETIGARGADSRQGGEAVQEVYDGNGTATSDLLWHGSSHPSDISHLSLGSPSFAVESFSGDLSRNTNQHTNSALSQLPSSTECDSFARSASQSSQNDTEWVPRLMQGGQVGSRLPPLAKKGINSNDSACGQQPLVNVTRKLQESQEQVKTLEDRLSATEGTVRYMSQRLRHYRSLLQEGKRDSAGAGLVAGLTRSQSESSLCPLSHLSLSLSCSNLHEGEVGTSYGSGTDMPGEALGFGDMQPSAARGNKKGSRSQLPIAVVSTLSRHIKAIKDRYSPEVEAALRQGVYQPGPHHKEEDGGSNMSAISGSVEAWRRDAVSRVDEGPQRIQQGKMGDGGLLSDATQVTMSEVSGSDWPYSQQRHIPSSSTGHHDNANNTLSPQETTFSVTLGDDVPDFSAMENLTYSSFSESILPMGLSQGPNDSAWTMTGNLGLQIEKGLRFGRPGASQSSKPGADAAGHKQGSGSSERGSSDEETAHDGNGTSGDVHSSHNHLEGSRQSESSRLKARVMVLSDMNRTLREELSVYDTLCRSMGIQVSAEGVGCGESGGDESCDGEMRLLQLHLAELRRLRARLEQLDTDAHNAAQMSSLLNSQHIKRISELEAAVARLRELLAEAQTLATERQTIIVERDRVVSETKIIREHQEKECELLRENLAAMQECETHRAQQHEAEMGDLQQEVERLGRELEEAQRQARDAEEELGEVQQRRQSYDVKFSQSQQHLLDVEAQLSKAKRRAKGLEAELHKVQQTGHDLGSQLSRAKDRVKVLEADLKASQQSHEKAQSELAEATSKLEESVSRLKESSQHMNVLETKLTQSEKARCELQREVAGSKESMQSLEEELSKLRQHKEELCTGLLAEKEHSRKVECELSQTRQDKQQLEKLVSETGAMQEECKQQQERAQHYKERMMQYEQCMRNYQQRVQDCETQVEKLKVSLLSSQSKEHDMGFKLQTSMTEIQHLQSQLKDAESRANTNESIAHRADTLARTLEGRLRELEAKAKDSEERVRESEYELKVSHSATSELNVNLESIKKELAERSSKLKKRDAQLKKLVDEYKKMVASQKETNQLNQTLKTEIKLYESMTCQTEVSRDKKEELMRQLLSELSQTRRLAEDLISRLEHNKRNDSPASTGGPEAADGRPSPEPRDSLHSLLSEANALRVHTDSHNSTGDSHASSLSEHTDARNSDTTPLSSPSSGTFSGSRTQPRTVVGATGGHGEGSAGLGSGQGLAAVCRKEGGPVGGLKAVEGVGQGHLRSYSHPTSLKYWQDHPHSSLSGSSGGPKVEVDSDVRRLFAISGLEGYEKLRRENGELLTTLSAMQARMTERLKMFTGVSISESVEYSTLRELQMSAQNLRICAEEEGRLLSCFWLTQLPPLNARGEFYDPKLAEENENLKVDLRKQKSRYDLLAHTVREQQERLHATNALRKKWETTLYKQLSHTNEMLERSKENFDEAGLSPPKSKSPRKSPAQPIKDKN